MQENLPINDYLMSPISSANAFSPEECQQMIAWPSPNQKYGETLKPGSETDTVQDLGIRHTLSKYIYPKADSAWIFERIRDFVLQMNQQYYKFQLDGFPSVQILEYPVNGFYRQHIDLSRGPLSRRKLSVIVSLSPAGAYSGGELQNMEEQVLPMAQGTMVIFPSYLAHQVTPVTQGSRHTLVTWILGAPFQ